MPYRRSSHRSSTHRSNKQGTQSQGNWFNFVIILGLVVVGGVFATRHSFNAPASETPPASMDAEPVIRYRLRFNGPQSADALFVCAIITTAPVTSDTKVQLYCTNTKLITAEKGGAFPTSLTIPDGKNFVPLILHTGKPVKSTKVTIALGQPGANLTDKTNWQAWQDLTINGTSEM